MHCLGACCEDEANDANAPVPDQPVPQICDSGLAKFTFCQVKCEGGLTETTEDEGQSVEMVGPSGGVGNYII